MPTDWWDDFFNNLATDLAPLISLFGESPTKQFLSESVSSIDILIFALAPLGILTTVVSAIRVGGSSSLRAFVGRAQEGGGNIEAELCSSTSRDVCEMYNNGGIARVFGRPKILEIVHDAGADEKDFFGIDREATAGIYPFREYVGSENGKREWVESFQRSLWPFSKKQELKSTGKDDSESSHSNVDPLNDEFAPHPNLSLNIGITKRSPAWFFLAILSGIVLQSGVLVFAGLSVFAFHRRFEKDGKTVGAYAFPFTLTGTMMVCLGVGMCGHIVERSTTERVFKRKGHAGRSRLFWIQPGNQVMGDQVFDSFSYSETPKRQITEYTASWRNLQDKQMQRTNILLVWIFGPVTILGFILQFVGLRALHSTVSIAQLGATIIMSIIRASLRMERLKKEDNRLGEDPDFYQGHELDWLAMELEKDALLKALNSKQSAGKPVQPEGRQSQEATQDCRDSSIFVWQVTSFPPHPTTDLISREEPFARYHHMTDNTCNETLHLSRHTKDMKVSLIFGFLMASIANAQDRPPVHQSLENWLAEKQRDEHTKVPRLVPRVYLSRARLARMTGVESFQSASSVSRSDSGLWDEDLVPARKLAKSLARAIEKTADVLFSDATTPPILEDKWASAHTMFLALECTAAELSLAEDILLCHKASLDDSVYVRLSRTVSEGGEADGPWQANTSEFESILSLWLWSLKMRSHLSSNTSELKEQMCMRLLCASGAAATSPPELTRSALDPWFGDLSTSIRRVRMKYPAGSGFDPTWLWTRDRKDGAQTASQGRAFYPLPLHTLRTEDLPERHWFFGWHALTSAPQTGQNLDALAARSLGSPADMCAQEIYTLVLKTLLSIVKDIGGLTKVLKGRRRFYVANDNITEIIEAFTEAGLGSEDEARACIIPALHAQKKLPTVSMLLRAREAGNEYRKEGAWKKAEEVSQWAFDLAFQSWKATSCGPTGQNQRDTKVEDIDSARELWLCTLGLLECYRWAMLSDETDGRHRLFGVQGTLTMLEKKDGIPRLSDIINVYGRVALRVSENYRAEPGMPQFLQALMEQEVWSGMDLSQDQEEHAQHIIISAIRKHDMASALYHLRSPAANQQDEEGKSTLSWAAERGWYVVVRGLIELGAVARQADTLARTPLHFAALGGDMETFNHLLEQGVDVDCRDSNRRTPLSYAAEGGHGNILKLLVARDASTTAVDRHGKSPLCYASRTGKLDLIKLLVESGAVITTNRSADSNPLNIAVRCGFSRVVKYLLQHGANPNSHGCLSDATCRGHVDVALHLLDFGASPNGHGRGRIPLVEAVKGGVSAIVKALIDHGADVNIADMKDMPLATTPLATTEARKHIPGRPSNMLPPGTSTPLLHAFRSGNVEAIRLLLEKGGHFPTANTGHSPLCYAALKNYTDCVQIMLQSGLDMDPNFCGLEKCAPMISALRQPCLPLQAVETLLKKGANPNVSDLWGRTMLAIAAEHADTKIVEVLLRHGADANNLETVRQVIQWRRSEIFELIWARLDKKSASFTNSSYSMLKEAVVYVSDEIIKFLLAQPQLELDGHNNGAELLCIAIKERKITSFKTLLASPKIDVNERTDGGYTPLIYAIAMTSRRPDFVAALVECANIDVDRPDSGGKTPEQHAHGNIARAGIVGLLAMTRNRRARASLRKVLEVSPSDGSEKRSKASSSKSIHISNANLQAGRDQGVRSGLKASILMDVSTP